MKRFLLTSIFSLAIAAFGLAQTSLSLQINHKLNGNTFAFNETGTSDLDEDFNANRLEYYLSQISIVHDGGTYTMLQDYALIDAGAGTEAILDLGEIDANTIEAISFYVGVDEENNHSDPASWTAPHPLAPRFPAMHWGWAAGYRFLAFEGMELGSNQVVQIHALGDGNYFETLVPINTDVSEGEMIINIDANYDRIFDNISLAGGLYIHSEGGPCITALENMRDHVFTVSGGVVSVPEIGVDFNLNAFPNPTIDGNITIDFSSEKFYNYDLSLIDILGKTVASSADIGNNATINLQLPAAGLYLLNLSVNGETILSQKVISQ